MSNRLFFKDCSEWSFIFDFRVVRLFALSQEVTVLTPALSWLTEHTSSSKTTGT
jgi:hypothetical protein